jgi:hypothetical protein
MKRQKFTKEECKRFEEEANPHQWFVSASLLHGQAIQLHARREQGTFTLESFGDPLTRTEWAATNKATFLLCAFALENAIKAFLVYEYPAWISEGCLHDEICNHKLVALSRKSSLIPYVQRDSWVLAEFEEGNESWMRYPCSRRASDLRTEPQLQDKLWHAYLRVTRGYGSKLTRLLGDGWTGPQGHFWTWKMSGSWLGSPSVNPLPG